MASSTLANYKLPACSAFHRPEQPVKKPIEPSSDDSKAEVDKSDEFEVAVNGNEWLSISPALGENEGTLTARIGIFVGSFDCRSHPGRK